MSGIKHSFTSAKSDGSDSSLVKPSDWNADHVGHIYPLDAVTLDGTYGDDFTASSLSGIWTRRNFTGSNETFQYGPGLTYLHLTMTGRTGGDGYLQTAPGGDWT